MMAITTGTSMPNTRFFIFDHAPLKNGCAQYITAGIVSTNPAQRIRAVVMGSMLSSLARYSGTEYIIVCIINKAAMNN